MLRFFYVKHFLARENHKLVIQNFVKMKRISFKKVAIALGVILVVLQFIRPAKNEGEAYTTNDITHTVSAPIPDDVKKILETSCFDCHSNHTNYPWYTNIQPIGLWMQNHVDDGKKHLNFSEYNTYKPKRKKHKLEEIGEEIKEHEMPLFSYTLIHTDAKMSDEQIALVTNWANAEVEKIILPDSLKGAE